MSKFAWTRAIWRGFHAGTISHPARDVALRLAAYWNNGMAWPSHATLAALTRYSVRTVQRALIELHDRGLLTWQVRRRASGWRSVRTSNLYRMLAPTTGQAGREQERKNQKPFSFRGIGDLLTVRRATIDAYMHRQYARFG